MTEEIVEKEKGKRELRRKTIKKGNEGG